MKFKAIYLSLILAALVLVGCTGVDNNNPPLATAIPQVSVSPQPSVDVVTTASIVNNEADFEKAISKDGTWIICALNNLTFTKNLVLDGVFKNGKEDEVTKEEEIQRKIALYTQDESRVVTNRFILKAPKLTINSPKASIQHGTFIGDLYVSADEFELVDATVQGNVYFTTDTAKSTFIMDNASKVTGVQELKK